jgi:hypothetical protein
MQDRTDRSYIGDGVYCSFDGYHVWLECERDDQTHSIALEPAVLGNLEIYVMGLKRKYGKKKGKSNAQET